MSAFEVVRELVYEKSPSETLADLERALHSIGKVEKVEHEMGRVQGRTKYGLNPVNIAAQVTASDGRTRIVFHAKSGDIGAVGAQKGIENLISTMQNLGNTQYVASKTAGVGKLWTIVLIIQIALSIILAFGLMSGRFPPGLLVFLLVVWAVLMVYLVLSRVKSAKKKQ